ncbi:hypothetical protein CDAR_593261 [Caerostris darwini]|uniref:Uncharacterized protein n=1 Tax=Caerostris darwini TaxID=1538125 RepID=A0AAV4RQC6_9ARAC|nr:hypothetical protein CDAR_593261 [Caerostris darwini]
MRVSSVYPEERESGRSLMSRIFPAPRCSRCPAKDRVALASSQDWKVTFSDYFWTFSAGRTRHFWRGGSISVMDGLMDCCNLDHTPKFAIT